MSKPLTPYLKKLVVTPPELSLKDFATALDLIFTGDANDVEIASFLTGLRIHRLDFDASYIAQAVETILKYSEKIPDELVDPLGYLDIVGTGENAVVLQRILDSDVAALTPGMDPLVDYILMNSAALAVVAGMTKDWKEGVEIARKSISSGAAKKTLQDFIDAVNKH
ncbi:hypothetical protein PMKS-001259 [Pichia membranifaciens]|uniref:Glycosyl transferase family 3 N-terminal domain-containing protein n=1 Tax=Pichia membranifaciens TaxID=4926 RepID=A0A1Q2YE64_9ASCO|nr:hypothetical protein PMKS-001259 [Pichia membranifaciens]